MQVILTGQFEYNRVEKLLPGGIERINTNLILKLSPETLDQVESGAVGWQPEDHQAVLKKA